MRELVRTAAISNGGHEVDWAGDGVFLSFAGAREAIAAAAEMQRRLSATSRGRRRGAAARGSDPTASLS